MPIEPLVDDKPDKPLLVCADQLVDARGGPPLTAPVAPPPSRAASTTAT